MDIFDQKWVFEASKITYKSETLYGPRHQNALQLVYLYAGAVDITIDDELPYRVSMGEVTLLLPGHIESLLFAPGTHHGWCYAIADHPPSYLLEALGKRPEVIPFSARMREIDRLIQSSNSNDSPPARRSLGLLMEALFHEYFHEAGCFQDKKPVLHPALEKVESYIKADFNEALSLDDLARVASLTPKHLIRLYKTAYGITPIRRLWQMRLHEAQRLLRQTGLTIEEVGYRCGFTTPQHFSAAFRKAFGLSPRQLRLDEWNQPAETK